MSKKEGKTRFLKEHEVKTIHHFIRSLLLHGIFVPANEVIFNATPYCRVETGSRGERFLFCMRRITIKCSVFA